MSSALAKMWTSAASGDDAAFTVFYRRHADRVFNYLWRRTSSREAALDLASEVFLLAWQRRERVTFCEPDDIAPWLLATANNLSRNWWRARARERARLAQLVADEPADDIAAVVDRYAAEQEAARVMRVLGRLRNTDRDVIEVCVIEGVSPAEYARATAVPATVVRGRLHRALRRARRAYLAACAAEAGRYGGHS